MAFFCEFSMATRSSSEMNTSEDRVITVFNCDSRSLRSRRWATSRVAIFSAPPYRRYAPLSFPPCPASTTTVVKVLLVFFVAFGAVAQAANRARRPMAKARLIGRSILLYSKKRVFHQRFFAVNHGMVGERTQLAPPMCGPRVLVIAPRDHGLLTMEFTCFLRSRT